MREFGWPLRPKRKRSMSSAAVQTGTPFRVYVVPIFRHYWLHYGCNAAAQAAQDTDIPHRLDWRTGRGLEEKVSIWVQDKQLLVNRQLLKQWQDLQQAKQGSIKNRLYRLAQSVLAKEEPEETFLKSVPSPLQTVEIIYPASFQERFVRRQLRTMVKARLIKHRRRLVCWGFGTVPLLPLLATPLPNIPLYYAGYRVYSHYRALEGARQLQSAFKASDAAQIAALRDQLQVLEEEQGVAYPEDTWPAHLLRTEKRYLDILEDIEARARSYYTGRPATEILPVYKPSKELDKLVQPLERLEHPISDEAVGAITRQFDLPQLMELVAKARRRLTGASFPR